MEKTDSAGSIVPTEPVPTAASDTTNVQESRGPSVARGRASLAGKQT